MKRFGIIIALGFLGASAFMNFQYGHSLGRTAIEGWIYGMVGVLAVGSNALCPFFLACHAKFPALRVGIGIFWVLCLIYSLSSAIGFAAENRQTLIGGREAAKATYEMTAASLAALEGKRERLKSSRYDDRIDELRGEVKRQLAAGANIETDPQSMVLASLTFLDPKDVRLGLQVMFGFMVELGAALMLFVSVAAEPVRVKAPEKIPMWRPKSHR